MCGMCLVIGVMAIIGGVIAFASGKSCGKSKSNKEDNT